MDNVKMANYFIQIHFWYFPREPNPSGTYETFPRYDRSVVDREQRTR